MLGMIVLSFPSFSQEFELKEINYLISDKNFIEAKSRISLIDESGLSNNQETKLYYYYLNFILNANAYLENDFNGEYRIDAIKYYNKLDEFQNNNKLLKYSKKSLQLKNKLLYAVINKSIEHELNKDYKQASLNYYNAYLLSKKDTVFLYQSAGNALNAKEDSIAILRYKELISLNYKGNSKNYLATNISTGLIESFGEDVNSRNEKVKRGLYSNPTNEVEGSKKPDIYKKLALIYINKSNYSEGEYYLIKAHELNPDDYQLYINLFYMYMDTNRLFKFIEFKEKALKKFNTNSDLYYNIGVVYYNLDYKETAEEYFLKGLELSPNDYLLNKAIGSILFDKDKVLSDQINSLRDSKKKRDELLIKKKENYQTIINYFKRAYSANNSDKGLKDMISSLEKYLQ